MTTDVKVVDITNDGIPDIVVAVNGGPNLLYPGDADGAVVEYPRATPIGVENENSQSVDVVDVDGDSDADVVFGNADGTATTYYNIDGSLSPQPHKTGESGTEPEPVSTTAVGTLDPSAPKPTLVSSGSIFPASATSGGEPWQSDPTGSLPQFDPLTATSVTVVDVNGDGADDVIVTGGRNTPNVVYINPGEGDFAGVAPQEIGPANAATPRTTDVEVVDVNGDGVPDIVVANDGAANEIFLGDPSQPEVYDTPGVPFGRSEAKTTDIKVVDINGDGSPDIVVANDGSANMVYYGNPTDSTPSYGSDPSLTSTIGSEIEKSKSVEVFDLNSDGLPEIIVGNAGAPDQIYYHPGDADLSAVQPVELPGTRARLTHVHVSMHRVCVRAFHMCPLGCATRHCRCGWLCYDDGRQGRGHHE